MTRRQRVPREGRKRDKSASAREWVGGLVTPPVYVHDADEPYRPDLAIWLELPGDCIVGQELTAEGDSRRALGRALHAALENPLIGPKRQPARIRVASQPLADEVRTVVGNRTPVDIAATPEIDAVLAHMTEHLGGGEEPSYLGDGRIPPKAVAELFGAAKLLYGLAPWKLASDDQPMRMDIRELGVEGACIVVIGELGEARGVVIFPSLAAYARFVDAGIEAQYETTGVIDAGTDWLALDYERGAELPDRMRREISAHGWPVAEPNAYPCVTHHDPDGCPRPLTEYDLRVAAACASALTAFFVKHRPRFAADDFADAPVCESWTSSDGLAVTFTAPYETYPFFDVPDAHPDAPEPTASQQKIGRNDPCPCGSGRKYKKCHLPVDEAAAREARGHPQDNDLGYTLPRTLLRFAEDQFGEAWGRVIDDLAEFEGALQLVLPWSLYHFQAEGASIAGHYLAARSGRLAAREREWITAQQAAWLSVWEVTDIVPGEILTLQDLLSEERRTVHERTASQTLVQRDAILARVVDHQGGSVLDGLYPRVLPPLFAAEVVRRARGRLRRKRAVPVERLREERFGRYLIARWEEAVAAMEEQRALPPVLHNTDGEAFILTTDHFVLAPEARAEVEAVLEAMADVEPPVPDDDPPVYVFFKEGTPAGGPGRTMIARVEVTTNALRVETNSVERANRMRARMENAGGERIRHRVREHADPTSTAGPLPPGGPGGSATESVPPEAAAAMREFKAQHYARWLDESIPALANMTPRESARTAAGRRQLDLLLKDMENHERHVEGGGAFDFSGLRMELGLD